ncbi:hypothetical protein GCM10007890_47560 [Methylobacterium tardum]|jgi:hypothetical protein|uniref:Uncharacterized protein n=1 Tax=Methylobacterium tardum TaxID=374432 RepID=A0AA37TF96_9HYPH|nr:hypothetical protein GCM10007890_47560 [Methylobacterium tardum]
MKRTERRFRRVHPFLDLGGCGDLLRDSTPESVRNAASAAHRDIRGVADGPTATLDRRGLGGPVGPTIVSRTIWGGRRAYARGSSGVTARPVAW